MLLWFSIRGWKNLDGNCIFKEGSFIFTGFQSFNGNDANDGENASDKFSIVTLGNIPAGKVFYLTDAGWKADDTFTTHEGVLRWTVGEQIPARTEIVFYSPQTGGFTSTVSTSSPQVTNVGIVSNVGNSGSGNSIQLTQNGDNIIVFTATDDTNPLTHVDKFLVAIKMENDWTSDATSTSETRIPNGLIDGDIAVAITSSNADNLKIGCQFIFSEITNNQIMAVANNRANWVSFTRDSNALPTNCNY